MKSWSCFALTDASMGLTLRMADRPLVPLRCLLFRNERTMDCTLKLPVDSLEYTCCTETCRFVHVPEMAKKLPCSLERTVLAVK